MAVLDILLTYLDLPEPDIHLDGLYLTEMNKQDYMDHFKVSSVEMGKWHGKIIKGRLHRIYVTLPLEVSNDKIIPIPFIVDTGAPIHLMLGIGARKKLKSYRPTGNLDRNQCGYMILKDQRSSQKGVDCLAGRLLSEHRSLNHPIVSDVPFEWLTTKLGNPVEIWKDERANILGLCAVGELNTDIPIRQIITEAKARDALKSRL